MLTNIRPNPTQRAEGHQIIVEMLKRRKDIGIVRACNHVYGALLRKRQEQEAAVEEQKKKEEDEKIKAKATTEV
jgi:hypothetical protein